jgi:hypothetical protein
MKNPMRQNPRFKGVPEEIWLLNRILGLAMLLGLKSLILKFGALGLKWRPAEGADSAKTLIKSQDMNDKRPTTKRKQHLILNGESNII